MKASQTVDRPDRRRFLGLAAAGLATLAWPGARAALAAGSSEVKRNLLPKLPWAPNALEPYISARTIEFHYGKHHAGYAKRAVEFTEGTKYADLALPDIIKEAESVGDARVFNNAAQVMNHDLYWQSMTPGGGGEPPAELAKRLQADFGSVNDFRESMTQAAAGQFGSGWAWLVEDQGHLRVVATSNAGTPITQNQKPVLVLDVWEHAYYLDYQNRRADYIKAWLDHLVNWRFAAQQLKV